MHDLRGHHRVEFARRAWCEHARLTLYLPVSNLSKDGMFLRTTTPFEPGETLKVSFPADGHQPRIVAQVEVVWARRAGPSSGLGCRVVRFLEGEEAYGRLVRSLQAA